MNIRRQGVRAGLLGIAAACVVATIAVASAHTPLFPNRDHVMTDPCAQVMNWPHRALIALNSPPPSERGLQCPIEEGFSVPASEF